MNFNIEKVKEHIEYFKNDHFGREFYIALLLYDVIGLEVEELNYNIMDKIYDISDDYDSIYNEDMRDRILEEFNNNKEEEREEDEELENDI